VRESLASNKNIERYRRLARALHHENNIQRR
jgi:hypothetical protein